MSVDTPACDEWPNGIQQMAGVGWCETDLEKVGPVTVGLALAHS